MTGHSIRFERPAAGVARIVLDRPERRNAQNATLLYELDDVFQTAAADETVKVVLLAGAGPDFSSGHDLSEINTELPGRPVATLGGALNAPGVEGRHAFECEAYLGLCRRWRDLPKPTIGVAHGRCIAGALMLLWPMDLIVAGSETVFSDPVAAFGLNGAEYFSHVWEVGARKAKEMLFTGEPLTARDAHRLGMVNHVVPDDELADFALELAQKIARMPAYGLRLAKTSVNQALNAQGFDVAMDGAFGLHLVGHANNLARYGEIIDPEGIDRIRQLSRSATGATP